MLNKTERNLIAVFVILGILGVGILLGMIIQQAIIFKGIEMIAPAFSGVEVNVDLNETLIVDEMSKVVAPYQEYTSKYSQQASGDPHNINIDATCPGRNTTKTVEECIKEIEDRAKYNKEVNNCTGSLCGYM